MPSEFDAKSRGHPVDSSSADSNNFSRAAAIAPRSFQNVQQIAPFHLFKRWHPSKQISEVVFKNLKESPEGTQYVLWQVDPDNSYTQLGHLIKTAKKGESIVDAEAAPADFGLLITFENAQVDRPAGSVVATIVK